MPVVGAVCAPRAVPSVDVVRVRRGHGTDMPADVTIRVLLIVVNVYAVAVLFTIDGDAAPLRKALVPVVGGIGGPVC